MAAKLLPNFQLVNKLQPQWLSHDSARNEQWAKDPLCHDTGSLLGLEHMLDRGEKLDSGVWTIGEGKNEGGRTRVLVCHGNEDHVNDFEGSRRYVESSIQCKDKELKEYDGFYHNSEYYGLCIMASGADDDSACRECRQRLRGLQRGCLAVDRGATGY